MDFVKRAAKRKERELIVKLADEGKTCREIASILGTSKSKASFWIKRFRETGTLDDRPRPGQPTKLTKKKLKEISGKIKRMMDESGGRAGTSTKEILKLLQEETGRDYTLRHVQRLLHKMGFSLITPRVSHIRKDEKKQEEFRKEFKKNSGRSTWVIK